MKIILWFQKVVSVCRVTVSNDTKIDSNFCMFALVLLWPLSMDWINRIYIVVLKVHGCSLYVIWMGPISLILYLNEWSLWLRTFKALLWRKKVHSSLSGANFLIACLFHFIHFWTNRISLVNINHDEGIINWRQTRSRTKIEENSCTNRIML